MGPEKNFRKASRKRVPTSCTVCRKRKIKCDRTKPVCGNCIKANCSDACVFEEQPWAKSTHSQTSIEQELLAEISRLKDKIKDLENGGVGSSTSSDIASNAYSSSSPEDRKSSSASTHTTSNTSIMSFNALMDRDHDESDADNVVELAKNFDQLFIKENKMLHFGATSFVSIMTNDPYLAELLAVYVEAIKRKGEQMDKIDSTTPELVLNAASSVSANDVEAHCITSDEGKDLLASHVGSPIQLIRMVEDILPPKSVCFSFIDRFFESCHIIIPVLDKNHFLIEIKKLMEPIPEPKISDDLNLRSQSSQQDKKRQKLDEEKIHLNITSKAGFATLCQFLFVLRFAYLSVPPDLSNYTSSGYALSPSLLKTSQSQYVIGTDFIDMAKACISQTGMLKRVNLTTIHCLLLLRIYRIYAFEESDEGTENQVLLSMLVQMSTTLGLTRDPSKFPIIRSDGAEHAWRKTWFTILAIDSAQSVYLGAPPLITSDAMYDTKMPFLTNTVIHTEFEKEQMKLFELQSELSSCVRHMMLLLTNLRDPPKRCHINRYIDRMQYILNHKMKSFDQLINSKSNNNDKGKTNGASQEMIACKCFELVLRIRATSSLFIFNYVIYLATDPKQNISLNERDKSHRYFIGATENALIVLRLVWRLIDPKEVTGADYIIHSALFSSLMRVLQMIQSLIIRCRMNSLPSNLTKHFKSIDSKDLESFMYPNISGLDDLGKTLYQYLKEIYITSSSMCHHSYRPWKVCQILQFFFNYYWRKFPGYVCTAPCAESSTASQVPQESSSSNACDLRGSDNPKSTIPIQNGSVVSSQQPIETNIDISEPNIHTLALNTELMGSMNQQQSMVSPSVSTQFNMTFDSDLPDIPMSTTEDEFWSKLLGESEPKLGSMILPQDYSSHINMLYGPSSTSGADQYSYLTTQPEEARQSHQQQQQQQQQLQGYQISSLNGVSNPNDNINFNFSQMFQNPTASPPGTQVTQGRNNNLDEANINIAANPEIDLLGYFYSPSEGHK